MTTILWRYLMRHNLTMVPINRSPYPYNSMEKFLLRVPGDDFNFGQYNMFVDHMVFNSTSVEHVMPSDTRYFSTIRYPLTQAASTFVEFGIANHIKVINNRPMASLVARPYYKYDEYTQVRAHSQMSRDFGLDPVRPQDDQVIAELLQSIDSRFDPVMTMEKFDESLVLLRRKYCWQMEDIMYTRQRVRGGKAEVITANTKRLHKKWAKADYALYNHFAQKLDQQLSQERGILEETRHFKASQAKLSDFCDDVIKRLRENTMEIFKIVNEAENKLVIEATQWNPEFSIHAAECAVMRLDTVVLRNALLTRQVPRLCTDHTIRRKWHSGIYFQIGFQPSGELAIHRAYCDPHHPTLGVPLRLLALRGAYMWLGKDM